MEERLQKILAQAGYGSRRACEEFILQGRVSVNGQTATLGQKADPRVDRITVDGSLIQTPQTLTYVALHKPRGVISSRTAQDNRPTVLDLVQGLAERVYPVGRLDADSEGLILLTNDGELTEYLTHPRYESEKEYRVLVRGEPDEEQLNTWRRGVVLEGKRTAPAQVRREEKAAGGTWLRVTMHEGRKHQIRDIGAALGLPVRRLIRVRMGALRLGQLPPGEWRELKPGEVEALRGGLARKPRPGQPKPRKRPSTRDAAPKDAPRPRPRRGE